MNEAEVGLEGSKIFDADLTFAKSFQLQLIIHEKVNSNRGESSHLVRICIVLVDCHSYLVVSSQQSLKCEHLMYCDDGNYPLLII